MRSVEIAVNGSFEQIEKFVKTAEENGYEIIHLRNCTLSENEIELIKKNHDKSKIFFDKDEEYEVICLSKDVSKGTMLTQDLIIVKKGRNGLTPKLLNTIIGRKVLYDLSEGTILTFGYIEF